MSITATRPSAKTAFYQDRVIFSGQVPPEPVALLASVEGISLKNSTYVFISKEAFVLNEDFLEDAKPQTDTYRIYIGQNAILRAFPVIDFAVRHTDTEDELNLVFSHGTVYLPPSSSRYSPYFLGKKMYDAMDEFSFVERPDTCVTLSSITTK